MFEEEIVTLETGIIILRLILCYGSIDYDISKGILVLENIL